ncbi:RimK family alpha-L-glutamate ligase [Candidatus Bathyarchaeota archaeon]|nr:RimK family alpha-L-glutamate ligase [Candidatus Bathyarchaeota archaeon]
MKILVLYGSKPSSNSQELIDTAVRLGHIVIDAPTEDVSSWVSQDGSGFWVGREEVTDADICFLRSYGPGSCEQITRRISLLEHMEMAGIRVINRSYPFRRARDKYATQYTLQANGVPVPTTYTTESLARAYEKTTEMGDVVYKPILGSMGRGSMRFQDTDLAYNAYRTLDRLHHPLIIQKFIKNPGRDIRVFVIGGEVAGAVYKYLPAYSWKSNVAQGGRMVEEHMSDEVLELGLRAAEVAELDYCGVDIMEGPDGPVVLEVNASPGWQGIKSATGKDYAKLIVEYGVEQVE